MRHFLILLISALCLSLSAQNLNYMGFKQDDSKSASLKKPIIHSMSIMTVNIFGLIVSGHADYPPSFGQFKKGFTEGAVWDDDHWTTNYIAHPLMGSETYLRAREAGFKPFGSFMFSSAMSLTWEFLIESWTEYPSYQDLLVTSTTGSLLGELRYFLKQKSDPKYYWLLDPINQLCITVCKRKQPIHTDIGFYLSITI